MSQFHLHLRFPGPGTSREDVKDQLRPVHDPNANQVLEVLSLRRRQLIIEDAEVRSRLLGKGFQLLRFSLADEIPRIWRVDALPQNRSYLSSRRFREPSQLLQVLLGHPRVGTPSGRSYQDGPFNGHAVVDELSRNAGFLPGSGARE